MKLRWSLLLVAVAVGTIAAGAVYLEEEAGVRAPPAVPGGTLASGAWFCPHGGGTEDWAVKLSVTNPGSRPVAIRVTTMTGDPVGEPRDLEVAPGTVLRVAIPVEGKDAGTLVEYFGGWVGVGWVARAGGDESGVAAEPCAGTAGRTWLLPDGTTVDGEDAWVVVMNPFGSEAVVGLSLITETRTVQVGDVTIPPRRAEAFRLDNKAEGERTVAAVVDASLGRVAAASLGVSEAGGVRAAVGVTHAQPLAVLPGALDAGGSQIPVMNPAGRGSGFEAMVLTARGTEPAPDLDAEPLGPTSVRTEGVTLPVPSSVVVTATNEVGVAAARRSLGRRGDQGSTAGGVPGPAWLVATSQGEPDDTVRVVLANPAEEPATIRVTVLGTDGPGESATVEVGASTAVEIPARLTESAPFASVLAVAQRGTFVAATASYSPSGRGYATALGVPIPQRFADDLAD